jgi:hypothetical protein
MKQSLLRISSTGEARTHSKIFSLSAWTSPVTSLLGVSLCILLLGWSHVVHLVSQDAAGAGLPRFAVFYYLSGSDQTHIDNYMCVLRRSI